MGLKTRFVNKVWNPLLVACGGPDWTPQIISKQTELNDIQQKQKQDTGAISDHLPVIYLESLKVQPTLIVELGVRGGTSTFVFERVARRYGATILSCDINECNNVVDYEKHIFVQEDDILLAARFPQWCEERGLEAQIDLLFVDTSHEYDHCVKEIEAWFPLLRSKCTVIFHDTNMGVTYRRKNGTLGRGWDNCRGVIRAIEEYFGKRFDEKQRFISIEEEWIVDHYPYSSGMTILTRI